MPTSWGSWAATARTMEGNAWGGSLTVQYIDTASAGEHPFQAAQVSGMGCLVGVELYYYDIGGPGGPVVPGGWDVEATAEVNDFAAHYATFVAGLSGPPPPNPSWNYWLFRVFAVAPGPTAADHYYCIGWFNNLGSHVTLYGATSLAFGFQAGMTNVVLKGRGGDSHPSTRNIRDFIDQHVEYGWFCTDTTASSITVTCPASHLEAKSDLSVSGAWGSGPGVGPLASDWPTTFELDFAINYNANTILDSDYVTITPAWAGVDLDLQYLDDYYYAAWEHWWNGTVFQTPWPEANPIWRVYGTSGAIKARRVGGAASDTMSWTGWSRVPYQLAIDVHGGKWNTAGGDWTSPISFDVAGLKDDAGARLYCGIGQTGWYTEAQHSWYTEDRFDALVQADVLAGWPAANGEVVADSPALIAGWDLTWDDFSASGYKDGTGLLDIAQAAVNVHKPAGVARPTSWTGSGGLVVTAETDALVTFTVAAGAPSPTLTRTFETRYWHQMDRLLPPHYDSSWSFKPDWPIYLKANLGTDIGGAIPPADPDFAALTADEDVTNWDNFSYLHLSYTEPTASNLMVALTFNELENVSDPCYTGWQYRFGPDGEWSYTKGAAQTATYAVDYLGSALSGAGSHYIDLRCPTEGDLSRGALQHVAVITITGFTPPGAGTDTWTLDGSTLQLCNGPVGTHHLALDFKRAYDWDSNFFGLAGWHDGAAILALQYGYEGFERVERGMKYQQYVQHNPGSSATTDPSTAKSLSRLADELSWQEGFTATWTTAAFDSWCKDADDVYLFAAGNAYWWWLKYDPDQALPLRIAPGVRTVTICAGVPFNVQVHHFLQGNVHGLLKDTTSAYRLRTSGAIVNLYKHPLAGGADVLVSTVASDAHGRFVCGAVPEEGYSYYLTVTGRAGQTDLGSAVNREWLSSNVAWSALEIGICDGSHGLLHIVYQTGGNIWHKWRGLEGSWSAARWVAAGCHPTIARRPDGGLCVTYQSKTGDTSRAALSKNSGKTWAVVV